MFVPLMEPAILHGYGPGVGESGLGLIAGYSYSAPYALLGNFSGQGRRPAPGAASQS
jgi:hypothetical protein